EERRVHVLAREIVGGRQPRLVQDEDVLGVGDPGAVELDAHAAPVRLEADFIICHGRAFLHEASALRMRERISSIGACFDTAARPASWLPRAARSAGVSSAVRKTTGMARVSSCAKSVAERSPPSMPGMSMSHRIR